MGEIISKILFSLRVLKVYNEVWIYEIYERVENSWKCIAVFLFLMWDIWALNSHEGEIFLCEKYAKKKKNEFEEYLDTTVCKLLSLLEDISHERFRVDCWKV